MDSSLLESSLQFIIILIMIVQIDVIEPFDRIIAVRWLLFLIY